MNTEQLANNLKALGTSRDPVLNDSDKETCLHGATLIKYMTKSLKEADATLKAWQKAYDKLEKSYVQIGKRLDKELNNASRIILPPHR